MTFFKTKIKDDEIFLSDKIELYPTDFQKEKIWKYINATRYIYNWIINLQNKIYNNWNENNYIGDNFIKLKELEKMVAELRHTDPNLGGVPYHICILAARRADYAYNMFFKKIKGKPRIHNFNHNTLSFDARSDDFYIENNYAKIEGFGKYHIKCSPRPYTKENKFYAVTVLYDKSDRYWLSVSYKTEKRYLNIPKTKPIGIDIGFRKDNSNTIVCSNGKRYCQPSTSKIEKRIQRNNKYYNISCKNRYTKNKELNLPVNDNESNNSKKRRIKLNKDYRRVHNIKENFYHEATTDIIRNNPEAIVVESLNIKDMNFTESMHVTSSYSILEKIKYKANMYNIPVIEAHPQFPSSQICSNCGRIHKTTNKIFKCPYCGFKIDRDDNAAINLERLATTQNDDFYYINGPSKQSCLDFNYSKEALYFW